MCKLLKCCVVASLVLSLVGCAVHNPGSTFLGDFQKASDKVNTELAVNPTVYEPLHSTSMTCIVMNNLIQCN